MDPSIVANTIVETAEVKACLSSMERAKGEPTPSIVRDPSKGKRLADLSLIDKGRKLADHANKDQSADPLVVLGASASAFYQLGLVEAGKVSLTGTDPITGLTAPSNSASKGSAP